MSLSAHLLSETDSAAFAGVGIETIREYERVGLLRAVPDRDGFAYGESDLRRVFQIPADRQAPQGAAPEPEPAPEAEKPAQAQQPEPQKAAPEPEQKQTEQKQTEQKQTEPRREQQPEPRRTYRDEVTYSGPGAGNSYDLLEMTRGLRDQVQMLREERDWLRKRVETLEVRLDRDQMLLLSETKNVRHLIQAQPKKTFWALPWLKRNP